MDPAVGLSIHGFGTQSSSDQEHALSLSHNGCQLGGQLGQLKLDASVLLWSNTLHTAIFQLTVAYEDANDVRHRSEQRAV